ncbi:MAG: phosphoenolpyruvate carboxylase, partial [Xanthomonadaceae bacterium]|nr:phosphoenolpyruvate carboxylase [Xanthomonadaceae bacterium]
MSKTQPSDGKALDETALRNELKSLRAQIPDQPSLNPVSGVAFNLSRRLEAGDIRFDDLKALSTRLMDSALVHRAFLLREQIGLENDETTSQEFSDFIAQLAEDTSDSGFEKFSARFARARNGIVFTAHPTFGLSEDLSNRLAEIAVSDSYDGKPLGIPHRPDPDLTLDYERERVQAAIRNLRSAYMDVLGDFFATAHKAYGDRAFTLKPQLATFASWVGYDLDGRTDINWAFSFIVRLKEKEAALADIRERFLALKDLLGEESEMVLLQRQVTGKLDLAIAAVEKHIKALESVGGEGTTLADAANIITEGEAHNLTTAEPVLTLLEQVMAAAPSTEAKIALASLGGLLRATGLGMSHIHVRVNAVQINNAFRAFVHESWTRDLTERQALARIVEMIQSVKPEQVNFETLDLENATAIRQFALVAQIMKYVDSETPIRYLIAESESPATILIALYFAKLFGVSEIVDISPLFETPAALESGQRLVQRLLAEEAYRDHVTKRGRLAVQTGYSDAGRFIGQIAAGLAHERLHHG